MAKAAIAQKNSRRAGLRSNSNSSMEDVLIRDANKLLKMVMDTSPIDTAETGQRSHEPRATVADQRPKRTSGERRRRSSSPEENKEASKKSKKTLEDDGSRDDDDDSDSKDQTKPRMDGGRGERTRNGRAPRLTIPDARRAPLAEPEDSTVTPEAVRDVCPKMGLLKCRSMASADDDVDGPLNAADDDFDDVDGDPDAENEEIIAEIAMQLRKLGDYVDSTFSKELGAVSKSASTLSISMMALEGIPDLISNLTYDKFQDVVDRNMGSEPGVQQVTVMFRLAMAAARQLRNATKKLELQRIALDYFRNNVVSLVSQSGGWDGVAESLR